MNELFWNKRFDLLYFTEMDQIKTLKNTASSSSISLSVELLGGVKLRRGRRTLSGFATQKVVGLLCFLLDTGRQAISREKLITMFWAESPEDQARYNLRYALWNIRKVFNESEDDPDLLITNRSTCQLNPEIPITIDCNEFERLNSSQNPPDRMVDRIQALELYKGPFLDGFSLRNVPEWEEWLYHRRESLHQAFLNSSEEVGEYCLQTGRAQLASTIYLRSLSFAPNDERAHSGLIRAYADMGRVSNAIRQYQIYSQLMKREFNAPAAPQLVRLIEALQSGTYVSTPPTQQEEILQPVTIEPNLLLENTKPNQALPPSQVQDELFPVPSGKPEVPFIGRIEELRDLKNLIGEVQSGQGLVLIVSGEMGIGKTRLLSEFVRSLPPEFILGIGESREIESTRPLEDLMQVLESIGRDPRLSDAARAELQELFELQEQVIQQQEGSTEPHLLEGIRRWIVSLAKQQPVLVALDDMHWAGEALHKVFSTLAQEVKRLPLLLIGIFRTFEENSEDTIASALISIARTGRLRRIELGSLPYENILEIFRKKAPEIMSNLSEEEVERIYRYSSGIPLYAIELTNSLLAGQTDFIRSPALIDQPDFTPSSERKLVPPLMVKISNFRLSQLPPDYVRLLKPGSLILGDFSVELAQALLGLDRDTVEDMMVDLEDRNLLHNLDRGGRLSFGFNHQMIKLAIAETITTIERQRLFRDILKAIELSNEPISNDARAYYLYNSGNRAEAIPSLMASARFWFGYGDRNSGLRYAKVAYESALERLHEEPNKMLEVIVEYSDFLIQLGAIKPAIDVLTNALNKISSGSGNQSNLLNRRAQLTQLLKNETSPSHGQTRQPLAIITAKRAIADVKLLQGDFDGSEKLITEVESSLENLPDSDETLRATGLLFLVKAKLFLKRNESARAIPLLESAAELLRNHGTRLELAETYRLTSRAHRFEKEMNKAADALADCYIMCQGEDSPEDWISYHHEMGLVMFDQENYDEAETHFNQAIEICRINNNVSINQPELLRDFARILATRGDKERARQMTHQAEETSKHLKEWNSSIEINPRP